MLWAAADFLSCVLRAAPDFLAVLKCHLCEQHLQLKALFLSLFLSPDSRPCMSQDLIIFFFFNLLFLFFGNYNNTNPFGCLSFWGPFGTQRLIFQICHKACFCKAPSAWFYIDLSLTINQINLFGLLTFWDPSDAYRPMSMICHKASFSKTPSPQKVNQGFSRERRAVIQTLSVHIKPVQIKKTTVTKKV